MSNSNNKQRPQRVEVLQGGGTLGAYELESSRYYVIFRSKIEKRGKGVRLLFILLQVHRIAQCMVLYW